MDNNEYISTTKTAEILGVTRQQVRKYIMKKILPSVQYEPQGRHRIRLSDVMKMKNGK
jgi:predicted transcriptional regulator